MKNFLAFILILTSSSFFACGFYPYGEELRFSFFNPDIFGYYSFSEFNYTSNLFEPKSVYRNIDKQPNQLLWLKYCKNKVSYASVDEALYSLSVQDIKSNSKNEMVKYLYRIKDYEAINYLIFAKNCEFSNSFIDDPWERNETVILPARKKLVKKAIQLSNQAKSDEIKNRYTFLAIRMSYYNKDYNQIIKLFDNLLSNKKKNDIILYWSLYFRTFAETDKALANYFSAQVFAHAPDKRFMIAQQFDREVPIESVLKFANSNNEKANVYLLAGIKKHDKALEHLKKGYELNPGFDGLSFLLLREVNKIEDWIFTPYYSLFSPSVTSYNNWNEGESGTINRILKRVETDRDYAKQVLDFIDTIDISKVQNPVLWKTCKAYLLFVTKDYHSSLTLIHELEKKNNSEEFKNQLDLFKALNLTAAQEFGKAIIKNEIKAVILKNKLNNKFIFALGRELEYKGNTSDAALLYSKIDNNDFNDSHQYYNITYWKSFKNKGATYSDFYNNYFDYINVMYNPNQVEDLILDIKQNSDSKEEFNKWKYSLLKFEVSKLYDLLGTMYIRKNDLTNALLNFKKVSNRHWNVKYSNWERSEDSWSYGGNVFDKNPFYEINYTPEFIPIKDTIRLNKYTITKQLIKYLEKANNVNEKDRDYYLFLVGNCYYNMTHHGNSWMMRRFYWSSSGGDSFLDDEEEFHQSDLAKKYYMLAKENAKTEKFQALCLRMIARCEKNKLFYLNRAVYVYNFDELMFSKNKYYKELKTYYSKYFNDLTSNCTYFKEYFESRR